MKHMMYCSECEEEREIEVRNESESYPVRGEETEIQAKVTYCKHCGEQIWNEEFEEENLKAAFSKYREKHELLQPEEIKAIREKYDLSQTLFAKILGLGEKTITRYENGSIQDAAQNNLIELSKYPDNFDKLLMMAKSRLLEQEYSKAKAGVDKYKPAVITFADPIPYQTKRTCNYGLYSQNNRYFGGVNNASAS